MTESTQSIDALDAPLPPLTRDILLSHRITRINDIIMEMRRLRRELRTLSGNANLKKALEKVTCLRCGYEWWPNNPVAPPKQCARCGSTAWEKPPTAHSRRPGDPERPWWRGRRQSRKRPARAIVRIRAKRKSPLEEMLEEIALESQAPLTIPPPPSPDGIASIDIVPPLAPPPDPVWTGSLSARLRGEDEPQPEIVSSHEILEEPVKLSPVAEEYIQSGAENFAEQVNETLAEAVETERFSAVVDAAIEEIGVPRTQAEAEELARAKEEAWPTTRPE